MVVYLPVHRPAVHAEGRRCTWMYETRNETRAYPCGQRPSRDLLLSTQLRIIGRWLHHIHDRHVARSRSVAGVLGATPHPIDRWLAPLSDYSSNFVWLGVEGCALSPYVVFRLILIHSKRM